MNLFRDNIEFEVNGFAKQYCNREGHTIERFKTPDGNLYFVTLKDSHLSAHGRTVAQAVTDAKWKDPKQRPSMEALRDEIKQAGKNRLITLNEFRLLTGACSYGCKEALRQADMEHVTAMTAFDIREKVSVDWGSKLLNVLEWDNENGVE